MADRRFPTSFKDVPDSDEPGLVLGDDNIVYLIKPDGSRVAVNAGGLIQIVGPYRIAWDTPPNESTATRLRWYFGDLPEGGWLLDVLILNQELWSGPDADSLTLELGPYDVWADHRDFVRRYINYPASSLGPMQDTGPLNNWTEALPGYALRLPIPPADTAIDDIAPVAYLLGPTEGATWQGVKLALQATWTGSAPAAGAVDCYAMIATLS